MHSLLDARQQWTLAAGAILLEANGLDFNSGYDLDLLEGKREGVTEMFERGWNIRDHESFRQQMESFREGSGHHDKFDQRRALLSVMTHQEQENYILSLEDEKERIQLQIIQFYDSRLSAATINAWDWGRAISITRMAMQIGYVDDETAWAFMYEMAQRIQQEYSSWTDFAIAYLIGRQYGYEELDEGEALEHFSLIEPLLERTDSPWNLVRWEEESVALPVILEREG
ncbi:hypothetical protein ASD24_25905 [Paenibacillus sp. Root52]|uniref:DUF1266 domain-containing protein n=1 Tax=Paenibacillus sp. Root52 TaxID=1736552 RepID=UPI0007017AB2|nr:DUF1266 domain-containing protein [Paenibacillus sp. Root52]KQY88153.1 hypothetical protein ASD24_25905 [Paenibacillus sp. Root52]